ncbi:hypothetical protein B0H13DRAFT_2287900 [Mycena leptocephala]|nr:hypothetical protein B0H13DRAFT_2287900 [Mycena leptocephala]
MVRTIEMAVLYEALRGNFGPIGVYPETGSLPRGQPLYHRKSVFQMWAFAMWIRAGEFIRILSSYVTIALMTFGFLAVLSKSGMSRYESFNRVKLGREGNERGRSHLNSKFQPEIVPVEFAASPRPRVRDPLVVFAWSRIERRRAG